MYPSFWWALHPLHLYHCQYLVTDTVQERSNVSLVPTANRNDVMGQCENSGYRDWKLTSQPVYILLASGTPLLVGAVAMGDLKHLVVVKFKEGVMVEEIVKGMEKLVSEIDAVKSFEWGQDVVSEEMLRQGFTHVFLMTFRSAEDFATFSSHPSHVEFSATFSTDMERKEMLRQGFTHVFLMTFCSAEDFAAFYSHPSHLEFSATFSTVVEKILLLDFPAVVVKPPA